MSSIYDNEARKNDRAKNRALQQENGNPSGYVPVADLNKPTNGSGVRPASGGGTAQTNPTTTSHRVAVPEHLQGGKVGTTWGYEDVARDLEERDAFEKTSTGGGAAYRNTGAGAGGFQWNQTRPAHIWGQYGGQGAGGYAPGAANQGVVDVMKEAYDAQAQARAAALEQMLRMYDGQNALIGQRYDQAARDAYANARLSAIGNNEALAAQGLAGGLYQNPTSGYSETARVMDDNALRSNLLSVQIARQQAKQQVEQDINALRAQGMYDAADLAASQAEALINLQMQLDEQQYQREIDAFNMQNA